MRRPRHTIVWSLSLLLLAAVLMGAKAKDNEEPRSIIFRYDWQSKIVRTAHFTEPSGIVYHRERDTLFVIGDEGDIAELTREGKFLQRKILDASRDLEGITYDPATGLLYVAVEDREEILEVKPDGFAITRQFDVERKFDGKLILHKNDNMGFESITFVPDDTHPEGGSFFLGNQSFGINDEENPSVIIEVELPLKSNTDRRGTVPIKRYFSIGIRDLSALHYDRKTRHLLVVSDASNTFFEVSTAGQIVSYWAFPGADQEGITLDDEDFMYIAQDSGGILKIKWLR
ncbi:MAG: SdiA-regulated domain-containing protein [Candidatus Lernaella stagnicola]|nr:SdiA-regulated domain-containing protein [Candidatus Lernaella stagnicola]